MRRGITLLEVLISTVILSVVLGMILSLLVQTSKLYAKTSPYLTGQSADMLALKRMQRELRDAMLISTTSPSPSTWVEIVLPKKDVAGMNVIQADALGNLSLATGSTIDYFLGTKIAQSTSDPTLWSAQASDQGTTLFRADHASQTSASPARWSQATIMVDGVVNPAAVATVTSLSTLSQKTLFAYTPSDGSGNPTALTQLISIAVIVQGTYQGRPVYTPLSTQFCMRNLKS